jgi:hypothetical protein
MRPILLRLIRSSPKTAFIVIEGSLGQFPEGKETNPPGAGSLPSPPTGRHLTRT